MISKVDIIITTKNRVNELIFTINHMISIGFLQHQFFIIDDASTDNTYNILKNKYSQINLFKNEISKGYILNRNFLMEVSTNDYIMSLDDDSHIRTAEDVIDALNLLEKDKSFGIFHFKAYNQLEEPPDKILLKNEFRLLRGYIGCGHIIKRAVFNMVGKYREEYVFYLEELDFAIRAYKLGFQTISNDNLIVHHRIDKNSRKLQTNNQINKGIYGREWRNIHIFSNNLIFPILYFPIGIDCFFVFYRSLLAFYKMVIIENQFLGFFKMLKRFFSLLIYSIKNRDKITFSKFINWIKLPDITSV